MNTLSKLIQSRNSFGALCDQGIIYSLYAAIFVLPASIALLDSFVALAVVLYFLKKIYCMAVDWPVGTSNLNLLSKILFIFKGFAPRDNFLNFPLLCLTLATFISVLFSHYPGLSLVAFFGKFIKGMFLYFSFIEVFNDEKRIRLFLKILLLSALITALNGLYQHYIGKDFFKGRLIGTVNNITTMRISSSFFGANGFGAYLLPVLALVTHILYSAASKKSWGWAAAMTVLLALLLICLCWTYSRSAWIGFLIILFVTVCLDYRKIVYTGILLLVFIFVFMPSLNNVRHLALINDANTNVQKEKNPQQESDENVQKEKGIFSFLEQGGSGRSAYWKKAFSLICSSPIWGTGFNTYGKIVKRDPDPSLRLYAHNSFLQLTAETGFLGLACFLWMLCVLLWQGLNYCRQIKDLWPLTVLQGTVAGLSGFFVQSFFDNTFYTVQLGILMWFFFGLLVAVTRLNSHAE